MTIIQHKRGLSTNWTSSDPVLAVSEIGYETDTGKFKIGDGASAWSALPYFSTSVGGSGTVTSITAGTGLSGGTITTSGTIALSHLGIESLTDPNADRILFWDDSASSAQWLTLGTNLSISGTTINATDTNTTYTAGTGLTLSGTEFSVTANTYQPLDADLTAIAALSANGLLRKTAGTWGMDTATYLTSYTETDTLSDVTGRGATTNTAISITNNTSSTTTTTGALKVTGGVGIQENLNVGGNLAITGDLTVNGTTTTINSTIVTVDDPIFTLGGDTAPGSDDNKDRGIAFRWHNGTTAKIGFFGFDDSAQQFTFIPDATITSEVVSGTAGTITANLNGNATSADTATTATTATDATSADTVKTIATATNASFYPVFVDANNGTATSEALYTDGGLLYNPSSNALTIGGNLIVGGVSIQVEGATGDAFETLLTVTDPTADRTITFPDATGTVALTSDISGFVTSVTGTSPVSSSGGTTPAISLASGYGDTQNPYGSKTTNYVLAGPAAGPSAAPSFRALVSGDIPDLSGTYLPLGGGTLSGSIAMGNNNITGVNALTISDPGTSEGILWAGGNLWKIYEAPDNLSNAAGNMQFVVDTTRVFTIDTSGNLNSVGGAITLGGTGTASSIKTLATTGTASGNLTISTGDTTTSGASGNITIDVGNGASSDGTISIGDTYASAITIGRTGVDTTFAGQIESTHASTWSSPAIIIGGAQGAILIKDTDASNADAIIGTNAGSFFILGDTASDGTFDTTPFSVNLTSGATTILGDLAVNGGDLTTTSTGTATLFNTNATTLNIGGAATTMAIGSSTSTVTFGNIVSADEVYSTNNGNGTNFKVGDDTWLGDINTANTLSIRGQQNAANAYIVFGNGDSKALGRAGTGRLTYDSALVPATYYKIVATDNTSLINIAGGVATTYSAFGTNGINLPVGSYEIDMVLLVSATTASNSSTLIVTPGSPSSAAVPSSTQLYYTYSDSTTVMTNAAATSGVLRTGTTTFPSLNTITIATGTTRYLRALVKGIVNIATAGNFTIRLAFAPGAGGSVTGTIYAGSYLKLTPLGAEAVTDIGTWA